MERLDLYIESLIFSSEKKIRIPEITAALNHSLEGNFSEDNVQEGLERLIAKYEDDSFAIQIVNIAGGYVFMTKKEYHHIIGEHLKLESKKKLSKAALETLSIVAYKQPITRTEIESLRGVGCDYTLQKLLEKELLEITGRSDGPGRPLEYATSEKFMNYFGLNSISELPKLKELSMEENQIGEPAPIEAIAAPSLEEE